MEKMEVNKFVKKLTIWFISVLVTLGTLIFISNEYVKRLGITGPEIEANLFSINENEKYDKLILGISHGRNFSRGTHHQLFESKKGRTINLAIGEGLNGMEIQKLYAQYFFNKGNKADSLYYILSPTLFYTNIHDQSDIAFYQEPINLDFIFHLLKNGNNRKFHQISTYLRSKLSHHWWGQNKKEIVENVKKLTAMDSIEVLNGFKAAYLFELSDSVFQERVIVFEETLKLFEKNNVKVKILIPPALFGKWPGHDKLINYLMAKKIIVLDLSESILAPRFYYDHHHLNTEGIEHCLELI
jgi:hypothetical protein